ncbi:MAG: hypothetical protein A4E61_00089 [Syntrophorhabdus sp. PtaB.Bin184]|nr:MAG: hypothetical protein A4E61_00089 [Syntrophorhabdus sp. PtaB.Bin184]
MGRQRRYGDDGGVGVRDPGDDHGLDGIGNVLVPRHKVCQRPCGVSRPGEHFRGIRGMRDIQNIRALPEYQLRQIGFKVGRCQFICRRAVKNLPLVLVKPDVEIPELNHVRLDGREGKFDHTDLLAERLACRHVISAGHTPSRARRQQHKVLSDETTRIIFVDVNAPRYVGSELAAVETRYYRCGLRHPISPPLPMTYCPSRPLRSPRTG